MCRGRRAMSSPQRMPVSIAVSTRSRCRSGIAVMSSVELVGVRVRDLRAMTLGSSVCSHGLATMSWSRTARLKIECSMVWYLRIDRGESPPAAAWVTQSWTRERGDLVHQLLAEEREEVLVQVGDVGGLGGGLDVLAGQPVGLDVVAERDRRPGWRRARSRPGPSAPRGWRRARRRGGWSGCRRSGSGPRGRGSRPRYRVVPSSAVRSTTYAIAVPPECVGPMSARCQQTLPELSEGWRRSAETQKMASDLRLYLTLPHIERAETELPNRVLVSLITQRSQVQILPPLPDSGPGSCESRA